MIDAITIWRQSVNALVTEKRNKFSGSKTLAVDVVGLILIRNYPEEIPTKQQHHGNVIITSHLILQHHLATPFNNNLTHHNSSTCLPSKLKVLSLCCGTRLTREQCDQIWRNFTALANFKNLCSLSVTVYLVLSKLLILLWRMFKLMGKFSLL